MEREKPKRQEKNNAKKLKRGRGLNHSDDGSKEDVGNLTPEKVEMPKEEKKDGRKLKRGHDENIYNVENKNNDKTDEPVTKKKRNFL